MDRGEYLLTYIHHDTYQKFLQRNFYRLEDVTNSRRDVELNIRYLLKLGVKNVDYVVMERIEDLLLLHHDFVLKMEEYLKSLSIEEVIDMLENS